MRAPVKFEGRKTAIFANLRTQSRHFEPHHSGKLGNLEQYGQSVARLRRRYQTRCGSHHPQLRSVVLLRHGVGQVNVQIDRL